jgi:hypothetical protein
MTSITPFKVMGIIFRKEERSGESRTAKNVTVKTAMGSNPSDSLEISPAEIFTHL